MSRAWIAGAGLLLVLATALYWLLPAYVLPAMDVNRQPAEHHDPVAAAAPVTSYVSIPISLSVDKIKQQVREQLSGKILVDNIRIPGRDLQVSIQRNGAMALWVHDADLHLVLPIKFQTRGDLKTKGELTVFTRASFNISRDWQPQVNTRSTFRWDWQPRVGVWPFRFRIGDILAPYIQMALDKGAEDFRSKAAGTYNIRALAEGGWERLFGPHPLDTRTGAWLAMQPRELYLEPITSDQSAVRLNLWMGGELGIAEGAQPAPAEVLPLPQLRHGVPPSKAVVLSAPFTVDYQGMLSGLRKALIGKPLAAASGTLVISDLKLYSTGPEVALGMEFEAERSGSPLPARGRLYLTGTPEYDPEARILSIRKMQLTPASANPLTHAARWVLEEAPAWVAEIERRMSWDTTGLVEKHQRQMDRYLNRTVNGRFDLWGDISEFAVTGAVPQARGVMLQAQGRGELELLFMP